MGLWNRLWLPVVISVSLASAADAIPAALGQPSLGDFKDVRELPSGPAGERLTGLLDAINAGDDARLRAFINDTFTPEFRDFVPMKDHLEFFRRVRRASGGLEFHAIRSYDPPRPASELVAVVRQKLTGEWRGIRMQLESAPPHRIAGLTIAPARPPTDLPPAPKLTRPELIAELNGFIEQLVAADVFSGAVLLAKDGEVWFKGAWGQANKDFDVPNKVDTKFNLGSINKSFTAVAIAQLAEQGKLSFADPVSKYLGPEWLPKEVADKITIEHLLTHTAGLGSYFNETFMAGSRERFRAVDDYKPLVEATLAFEPGTQYAYSNTGYLLLGAVVERVTGGSYYDYVRKHIYTPAGMTNSDCYDLDRPVPNLAVGYTRVADDAGEHWETNLFKHVIRGGPAGGGLSTVEDLLRFDRALRANKLVKAETAVRMWTPSAQSAGLGQGYGYGFAIRGGPGNRIAGHSGGFAGVSARFDMYLDAGYTVVVLCNYDQAAEAVGDKLAELLARLP